MIQPHHLRQRLIAREGRPTDYGGRTVLIEVAGPKPRLPTPQRTKKAERDRKIQEAYLNGRTGDVIAHQFHISVAAVYEILRKMGTPMRPAGKRRA